MLSSADIKRHIRYHQRFLGILPTKLEGEDPNKMSILYFSLSALSLLGYQFTAEERESLTKLIYECQIENELWQAFAPSYSMVPHSASLSATCFAIQCLLILGDDLEKVDTHKISRFVSECTLCNYPGSDDKDLRFVMLSLTILKLIKVPFDDILNIESIMQYIISLQALEGGFSNIPGGESHAGLTFCAVDALHLMSKLSDGRINRSRILEFLVKSQISYTQQDLIGNPYADESDQGGFNGRYNKYGDTCYVFWCMASLALIGQSELVDQAAAVRFLLEGTQNAIMGGFNKTADDDDQMPDPFHSFLGLAALTFLAREGEETGLGKLDPELVIPVTAKLHWVSLSLSL